MNLANLYECDIVAVAILTHGPARDVVFTIIDHEGLEHRLIAKSVEHFSLDQMRLQNLIENVSVYDNRHQDDLEPKILSLLQGRTRLEKDKTDGRLNTAVGHLAGKIANGTAKLMEINTLYGLEALMIADDVYLE